MVAALIVRRVFAPRERRAHERTQSVPPLTGGARRPPAAGTRHIADRSHAGARLSGRARRRLRSAATCCIDAQGRPIANDFVNVWAAGRLALDGHRLPPTTGRCTGRPKSAPSATTSPIITAGITRRLFCLSPPPWRRCLILSRRWCGSARRSPPMPRRCAQSSAKRAGIFLALGFPAALWNVTRGPERFFHRGADRRNAGLLCNGSRRWPVCAWDC